MRPILEILSRLVQPTIKGALVVCPETGIERHVMGPHTHVHRVELNEPDGVHHPAKVPYIDSSVRSCVRKPLSSKRYPTRGIERDSPHRLTFTIPSTLPVMPRTLLAGIRTFVLVPLFFIVTLGFALTIITVGFFRPASPALDRMLNVWAMLFLKVAPVHVESSGLGKIDPSQRYVVASNHLSLFDIPLLMHSLPLPGRFLSKKEVFKIPLVGRAMRTVGIIEINREKGGSSRQAINEGVQIAAERGYSLLIFPEGTRSTEGTMLPFHKGAFRIAIDTGLPLLPVVIEGTDRVNRSGSRVFFPGRATIRVLDPIETADMTNKDNLRPLATQVEADMNAAYSDLRRSTAG